jgi:hypothetical protein
MRKLANFLGLCSICLPLAAAAAGCTGPAGDACGLSGAVPSTDEIASGQVSADRDGSAFTASGTWRPPPGGSFTAGNLDVIMENDEEGNDTADLITEGTFPICVTIGDRSETSGQANLVEGGYVSDGSNGGTFAILAEEDGEIVGRFAFTLANTSGDTTTFSEGLFRVPQR